MAKLISFVVPVFRNAGSLEPSYQRIKDLLLRMGYAWEIVFVNDGSDDNSLPELIALNEQDSNVKVISFSRNFGQVAAITAGFRAASGECCVLMSADLQDPIEKAEEMIRKWEAGTEIAICYRADREDSLFARMTSAFFYRLIKVALPKMPEGGFDFLLLDKKVLAEYNKLDERNRFFQGDILWLGFNVTFIPYSRQKRTIGKSQWSFSKKLKYFIDGLLNTSYIPIRLMSVFGLVTALSGFLYALIIIYARLIEDVPFSGWAPIMILILIIGGVIMLMLGIIGEYLWRSYDESRKRPLYIVDQKIGIREGPTL
jgi:glycosyltransferase involved in cell wall biosynthesis